MPNTGKASKTSFSNVHEGACSKHEHCYGSRKKFARNLEYSKSDNYKNLSVLGQILSFLHPHRRIGRTVKGQFTSCSLKTSFQDAGTNEAIHFPCAVYFSSARKVKNEKKLLKMSSFFYPKDCIFLCPHF